ncbi:MAG: 16S rRNA (guanine(966)-N(2))-methyltransferase RsmD [Endomicrobium sp.]|jgi:16S rRNA (guanine(966)-N(2))-methyltransferase RsmD|nr:16S rRNA (guanine(966)-N(2))-methyltransferase RsmD [Endomicrobium sp.]
MTLKIISGIARGRALKTLPMNDLSIRPMLYRVKKSVFDIIKLKILHSVFIDLFAGVGSVGIEAISRGAKTVVFVELSKISLSLIRYNVNKLNFNDKSKIIRCDIVKNFSILKGKYDIIFVAPPYRDKNGNMLNLTSCVLKNSVKYNILKTNSLLITQRHASETVEKIDGINCFRSEKYGDTLVSFYNKCL